MQNPTSNKRAIGDIISLRYALLPMTHIKVYMSAPLKFLIPIQTQFSRSIYLYHCYQLLPNYSLKSLDLQDQQTQMNSESKIIYEWKCVVNSL